MPTWRDLTYYGAWKLSAKNLTNWFSGIEYEYGGRVLCVGMFQCFICMNVDCWV